MSLSKILTLTIVGVVIIAAISIFSMYVSYNNGAMSKYKTTMAEITNVENVHNQMWSILRDEAKVPSSYADKFDKIYTDMIAGRYSKGDGTLMKWIKESNPNFDSKLYEKLMNDIEIQRTYFSNTQKSVIDKKREYDTYINTMPNKWFISKENSKPIEYVVISSSDTKKVIETRVDDNELEL